MKGLVLFSLIMLLVLDQNQDFGDRHQDHRLIASLSLITMDALIVVMWESAVSQVYITFILVGLRNSAAVNHHLIISYL